MLRSLLSSDKGPGRQLKPLYPSGPRRGSSLPGARGAADVEGFLAQLLLSSPGEHSLDSYAVRHLVLSAPARFEELSTLTVGNDTYVSRCAVVAESGEEAVLTITLKCSTSTTSTDTSTDVPSTTSGSSSDPPAPAPSEQPQPEEEEEEEEHGHAVQSGPAPPADAKQQWAWHLLRVSGEPTHNSLSLQHLVPSPEFPPETIVQAQLSALQQYEFAQSFALLSPSAQALVGPVDRFINILGKNRMYRTLVHHRTCTSLRRCQASRDTYLEVVAVQGSSGTPGLYCWVIKRQPSGSLQDCWLTDWVKPVDDPQVLKALGIPFSGDGDGGGRGTRGRKP